MKKHPLFDKQFNIEFENEKYGRLVFSSGKNPLNGNWMWWWNVDVTMYSGNKKDVNTLIKAIREKALKIYIDTFWK